MRVRGPNNVGRAVQADPSYGDHGKKKKCWELLAQKFNPLQTCATTPI